MLNPVFTSAGHTYERSAIEEHFKKFDWDPMTRQTVNIHQLTTNWNLKSQIAAFIEKNRGNLDLVSEFLDAVESDDVEEIDRAIILGVDVNVVHERGNAMSLAIVKRSYSTFRRLVEHHKLKIALLDSKGSLPYCR